MLLPAHLRIIARTWPLSQWRYPWAFLSNLNPYTAKGHRLISPGRAASASLFHRQGPDKVVTSKYFDPLFEQYYFQDHFKYFHRRFFWPMPTLAGLWLVSQWESLSAAQQLAWDAGWFWPDSGMDAFMWSNATRVFCMGQPALVTTPPAQHWLPLMTVPVVTCSAAFADSYDPSHWFDDAYFSGYAALNTGSYFDPSTSDDQVWVLYHGAYPCVDYTDPYSGYRIVFQHKYYNALNPPDLYPWEATAQAFQPQYVSLSCPFVNYHQTTDPPYWPPGDWPSEFNFQIHTFLRDGSHGCTDFFFPRPGFPTIPP